MFAQFFTEAGQHVLLVQGAGAGAGGGFQKAGGRYESNRGKVES